MTRKHVLEHAKIAGYHGDTARFTRLCVEGRVNRPAMLDAWRAGLRAKLAGIKCTCRDCNPK